MKTVAMIKSGESGILSADDAALISAQPIERLRIASCDLVLLGTAHVSKASADAVEVLLRSETFDHVAIELDAGRHQALIDPESYKRMDLIQVFKSGRALLVAANLALSAYQRRLAEQVGIEPGAEMLAAHQGAQRLNLPLELIDRDVGITLNRCRAALGFWGGSKLVAGSVLSTFSDEEIAPADIEKLKSGDMLNATFGDFSQDSPELFEALIAERDQFMAANLLQLIHSRGAKHVLAVVGAGHLKGMMHALQHATQASNSLATEQSRAATLARLNAKPTASNWPKLIGWAITAVLIGGMIYGFSKGFQVGQEFLKIYLGVTIVGGFLGSVLAGAHPLASVVGGLSSPLTVLHPALSSGMFSATVEVWLRKPIVQDFEALREDLKTAAGWWKNRVSRTLLVFILTNLGTAIGVWIVTGWFVTKIT